MTHEYETTILFSSAGRRVALINNFRNAAKALGIEARIVAADMNPSWSPACLTADIACKVVRCTSVDFIPQMLEICHKHNIKLIVPTIDTELLVYAENSALFKEIGTKIHISDSNFVAAARDKEATFRILRNNHIPVPESWNAHDLAKAEKIPFPLFLKPKGGSGSKGISFVFSIKELREKIGSREDWLAQEVCTGQEYTINCFYNREGVCVSCVPHLRKFVRDGEVCFAVTERVPEFSSIAHQFSQIFQGIWGCICFQGFKNEDGNIQVFEINARFGGGYPICDYAGGTFARWILQDVIGITPDYHDNWHEGVRMLRYDEAFFLTCNGEK
jgi:carbamoyl-phosphate synthase large subunit